MNSTAPSHRRGRALLYFMAIATALVLAAFIIISLRIGADVKAASALARTHHPGNRIESLIQFFNDDHHGFSERNRAVWALGQLGDPRALEALQLHRSGQPCDHESALCQRELEKAIALVTGGFNATALVWRRAEDG